MVIHDISQVTTPGMVTWDDAEAGFSLQWQARTHPHGADTANVSQALLGSHTGTHLDAPLHFIPGGTTVEALDVGALVGPAQVVRIYGRDLITAADLDHAQIPQGVERIVFQTDNTHRGLLRAPQFQRDYVGLAPGAAEWLVTRGVRLVGVDYLSVGPYGEMNIETHKILLGAGVVVVEGLKLDTIQPGAYTLIALPPKFDGAEGSPCRALLVEGALA